MNWNLNSTTASFSNTDWNLRGDFDRLSSGWLLGHKDVDALELLGIHSSVPLNSDVEVYCSSKDLIVDSSPADDDGLGLRLRSRMVSVEPSRLVLQTTVSIQTRAFDARPEIGLGIPNGQSKGEYLVFEVGGFLGAVVVDGLGKDVTSQKEELPVFSGFLERGVIRKCRFRLIMTPAGSPGELMPEVELERLRREPLPLLA